MFGGTSHNKLLVLPKKSLNIISLNKKIKPEEEKRSCLIRSFLLLQHSGNQTYLEHVQSYINITRTGSNILYQKIAKYHNRDGNSIT